MIAPAIAAQPLRSGGTATPSGPDSAVDSAVDFDRALRTEIDGARSSASDQDPSSTQEDTNLDAAPDARPTDAVPARRAAPGEAAATPLDGTTLFGPLLVAAAAATPAAEGTAGTDADGSTPEPAAVVSTSSPRDSVPDVRGRRATDLAADSGPAAGAPMTTTAAVAAAQTPAAASGVTSGPGAPSPADVDAPSQGVSAGLRGPGGTSSTPGSASDPSAPVRSAPSAEPAPGGPVPAPGAESQAALATVPALASASTSLTLTAAGSGPDAAASATAAAPTSVGAAAPTTAGPPETNSTAAQPGIPATAAVVPRDALAPATVAGAASARPVDPPLAQQLLRPLTAIARAGAGDHTLSIAVAPEALGPVTVRAHVGSDGLRIELFAPTDAGREAVRAIIGDLRRDLATTGLGASLDLSNHDRPATSDGGRGRDERSAQGEPAAPVVQRATAAAPRASVPGTTHTTIDVMA